MVGLGFDSTLVWEDQSFIPYNHLRSQEEVPEGGIAKANALSETEARNKLGSCLSLIYFRVCYRRGDRSSFSVVPPTHPQGRVNGYFGEYPQWCWGKCDRACQILLSLGIFGRVISGFLAEVLFIFASLNSPLEVVTLAVFLSEFFRDLPGALNIESSDVFDISSGS